MRDSDFSLEERQRYFEQEVETLRDLVNEFERKQPFMNPHIAREVLGNLKQMQACLADEGAILAAYRRSGGLH